MPTPDALFPTLLADEWPKLGAPVRRLHDGAALTQARGLADVDGSAHWTARLLRKLLGLPEPGPRQALHVTIRRDGMHERWTRRFAHGAMHSTLFLDARRSLLHERLGIVTLCFALERNGEHIDWHLHRARVLGLPCPRALLGEVLSLSGSDAGRYIFVIDVRLPLLGQLVAYRGWLELVDAD